MKTLILFGAIALSINIFAQNVDITDAVFKSVLINDVTINTNLDADIQVSEAEEYTGSIVCSFLNISDLTGIEAFIALTALDCSNNELTSLDVSQNTALTTLDCGNNQLTSLDIFQNIALVTFLCRDNELTILNLTQNPALVTLSCQYNQLSSLTISQNTNLANLDCDNNQLTSLDVSQNIALVGVDCRVNEITSIDFSMNTFLIALDCTYNNLSCLNVKNGNNTYFVFFSASFNPNITCIEVDNVNYSNANWANIDTQTSYSTSCASPCALGVYELSNTPKQLIKIVDLMGRETEYKPNTVLIYVYSDGTTGKVFKMED